MQKEVHRLGSKHISDISRAIMNSFHTAANSLEGYDGEDRDTLQLFNFIRLLCFDIYLRKQVIERREIDSIPDPPDSRKKSRAVALPFFYSPASLLSCRRENTISYPSFP